MQTEHAEALQATLVFLWAALAKGKTVKSAKARNAVTKIRAAVTSAQNALEEIK